MFVMNRSSFVFRRLASANKQNHRHPTAYNIDVLVSLQVRMLASTRSRAQVYRPKQVMIHVLKSTDWALTRLASSSS